MMVVDNLGGPAPTRAAMGFLPPTRVPRGSSEYPVRLEQLGHPPPDLWAAGRLPAPGQAAVAIVGARAAGAAGCARARQLAGALARRGIAIVSGGAYGIDAAAHEGALAAEGTTFAVLGCGVDVIYPARHEALFADVAARGGGLLSEYPPGTKPRPGQFPARNRLIAALADVVIVVEADWRSGALSTAVEARRLGRPVMASPGSPGTDRLISRGQAGTIVHEEAGPDSVAALLAGERPGPRQLRLPATASFGPVVAALGARADTAEGLSARLAWPLAKVMSELGLAEIEGWIRRAPGGAYEVTRAH